MVEASEMQASVWIHCTHPSGLPKPHLLCPELTIICVTSSAFLENWKELACALLHMAWQTMHRLWTRHSFRAGS